jgi:hypothetical protein
MDEEAVKLESKLYSKFRTKVRSKLFAEMSLVEEDLKPKPQNATLTNSNKFPTAEQSADEQEKLDKKIVPATVTMQADDDLESGVDDLLNNTIDFDEGDPEDLEAGVNDLL